MQAKNLYLRCAGSLFLHIFLCIGIHAQGWQVKHYSIDDGLPHDVCYGIHQDQKGFIWIGTDLGLARFDGSSFRTYGLDAGLTEPYIITVGETPQGKIWTTPYEKGLFYQEDEKFEKYPFLSEGFWFHPQLYFISDSVWFEQDKRVDIYAGITGLQLPGKKTQYVRWHYESGKLKGFNFELANDIEAHHKFVAHQTYDDGRVISLHCWSIPNQRFWLGSEHGVFILDDLKQLTTRLAHPKLAGIPVMGLHGNDAGELVIGSKSTIYLLKENGNLLTFKLPAGVPTPHGIKISNDGKAYWSDVQRGQLWTIDFETGTFTSLTSFLQLGANISHFHIDHEGGVWFSTDGDGCYVLRNQGFQNLGKELGLKSLYINDFLMHQDSTLFIAHKKGVQVLQETDGEGFRLLERDNYPNREIYKIKSNDEGNIYVSGLQGIREIFPEVKLLIPNQLPDFGIHPSGEFILSLTNGFFLQGEGKKPQKWLDYEFDKELGDYGIEKGRNGAVYVSTELGLYLLKPDSQWNPGLELHSMDTVKAGLSILNITIDDNDDVYYASEDSIYHQTDAGTQAFPIDKKQIGIIKSLAVDDNNDLWIGTTTGLHKWSEQGILTFHEDDGLTSSDITDLYKDLKGRLWIGTSRGISLLADPSNRQARIAPQISLNSILLDGSPIEGGELGSIASQNTLNLKYDVVELQSPDHLIFQFQLNEGAIWQDVASRELTLSNLSVGAYQIRLRVKNSQSDWRITPPVAFEIQAPWWSKWWAWVSIALIIISLSSVIIRARIQSISRQAEAQNELNQQMAHLQLSALQAQLNPHFIFNALNSIQFFILNQDEIAANDYLTKFSRLMRLFLEASHSRTISLSEELELLELYIELEQLRFEGMFEYEIKLNHSLDPDEIEVPSMMLQPFVENAINHGLRHKKTPGLLQVYFEKDENEVLCVIEDDGIGKEASKAIKARRNNNNKSYGMELLEDRIKVLNQIEGTQISINSIDLYDAENQAVGTRVEIRLPI